MNDAAATITQMAEELARVRGLSSRLQLVFQRVYDARQRVNPVLPPASLSGEEGAKRGVDTLSPSGLIPEFRDVIDGMVLTFDTLEAQLDLLERAI